MEKLKVELVAKNNAEMPTYATSGSSGMDLRTTSSLRLEPLDRVLAPTGLHIALPEGYEAQIRPRSGMAYKKGITLANCVGTIDSDYRGEIKVALVNLSMDIVEIPKGERIAQLVVAPYTKVDWTMVTYLSDTDRGEGGFGSTGTK